ncbi:hypothetical protein K474DRAFT_1762592 [Panus rudis PR-1116 ss-1]|nr:hypothetical protein K474DRAFT_1762592 [Panus rudis PR-1116 ss-1]
MNSNIIEDMTDIGQLKSTSSESDSEHNVTFVHLTDTASDMSHFLKSICHIGTKYGARMLRRRRALDVLLTAYPTSLHEWDERSSRRLFPPFSGDFGAVLSLAFTADAQIVLSALFYESCMRKQPISEALQELFQTLLSIELKQDICMKFTTGRERIATRTLIPLMILLDDTKFPPTSCKSLKRDTDSPDALTIRRAIDDELHDIAASLGLWELCESTFTRGLSSFRKRTWTSIPEYFGLPSWDDIKEKVPSFQSSSTSAT